MERFHAIDAVRGFALLGILVMNIFGMAFSGAYLNPHYSPGPEPLNTLLWMASAILVDGKMRALFAMLFGASILLMSECTPEGATGRHVPRMLVLLVIGMAHAWLLWGGDILVPYAIVGLVIFPWRDASPRALALAAVLFLGGQAALTASFGMTAIRLEQQALMPGADENAQKTWAQMKATTWPSEAAVERQTNAMRGSLPEVLANRAQVAFDTQTSMFPLFFFFETIGLMCAGMLLFRLGWWQGGLDRRVYLKTALMLIPAGLAVQAVLTALYVKSGFSPAAYFLTDAVRVLVAPPLAVGYSAALLLVVGHRPLPRLAAVGRTALSNYIGASVVATLLFTGFGLGLFGRLDRAQVLLVVVGIWSLQLLWSKAWIDRFRYGPMEWLWRTAARMKLQPMRRTGASGTGVS